MLQKLNNAKKKRQFSPPNKLQFSLQARLDRIDEEPEFIEKSTSQLAKEKPFHKVFELNQQNNRNPFEQPQPTTRSNILELDVGTFRAETARKSASNLASNRMSIRSAIKGYIDNNSDQKQQSDLDFVSMVESNLNESPEIQKSALINAEKNDEEQDEEYFEDKRDLRKRKSKTVVFTPPDNRIPEQDLKPRLQHQSLTIPKAKDAIFSPSNSQNTNKETKSILSRGMSQQINELKFNLKKKISARVRDEILQEKRLTPLDTEALEDVYKYKQFYIKYKSRRLQNYDDSDSDGERMCQSHSNRKHKAQIEYSDSNGVKYRIPENPKLTKYAPNFQNLLVQRKVITNHMIVLMQVLSDSSRVICVSQESDHVSHVEQFSLEDFTLKFHEQIGVDEQTYIKVKQVEQNETASEFVLAYFDDGKFRLRFFGRNQRDDQKQIEDEDIKINELIGLDNFTMSNDGFPDPFITCCFLKDHIIFVNFFHNYTLTHYHFIWNKQRNKMIGGQDNLPIMFKFPEETTNIKNFPTKCFFNDEQNVIFTFYRQSQSLSIEPDYLADFDFQQMQNAEFGDIILFYNKVLITQTSNKVLFWRRKMNLFTNKLEWILYNTVRVRGFIHTAKGNNRMQIVTDTLIYFYVIDLTTFEPKCENVLYNYMSCTRMMIGKRGRNCVTYKNNERDFTVYNRKYMHNLRVQVQGQDYQGSMGVDLSSMNTFVVSQVNKVIMFDSETYSKVQVIPIPLLKTQSREPNEIIGMQKSEDEQFLAIISGKNLVMNEQKQNQLFIFKREAAETDYDYDQFVLHKHIEVKEIPIFNKVCMQFFFKNPRTPEEDPDTLIFCKNDIIFELNFEEEFIETIFTFDVPLNQQPNFMMTNDRQNVFVIAGEEDGIHVNIDSCDIIDLDDLFGSTLIEAVTFDEEDELFYFLANKKDGIIGFYLIKFDMMNPRDYQYMTMWRHKLDIGDANISILRGYHEKIGNFKELIVGYKTININTYTLVVFDISGAEKQRQTLQKHECFQLWESTVSGILIKSTNDYVTLSKTGINVLSLGRVERKQLKDSEGLAKMIHSLNSLTYLKLEKINFVNFKWQNYNNRIVSIEQEWKENEGTDQMSTNYDPIYEIKIHEITLRELLILQSAYVSKSQKGLSDLVKLQPDPSFFYKTFLELDGCNFASILSFDQGSMKQLLGEHNKAYFNPQFPIIYKNQGTKRDGKGIYYTNALIQALKQNQVTSINYLIEYIVKYQNHFTSSFLFTKVLPKLIDQGIQVSHLLSSKIFYVKIEYDEWPQNHNNLDECIRPYSGSIFHLRHKYKAIFPESVYESLEEQEANQDKEHQCESNQHIMDASKIYKIAYYINLFPIVGKHYQSSCAHFAVNEDISIMGLCVESDELKLFDADTVESLITYKWTTYGKAHHTFGLMMHIFYVFSVIAYVNQVYIWNHHHALIYNLLIGFGVFYPAYYDIRQLRIVGAKEYLTDPTNIKDIIYIYGSLANVWMQLILGPFHIACRVLMVIIVLIMISKTFFFLTIFPALTPVVNMILTVFWDLRFLVFFYILMLFYFSQVQSVLGIGSHKELNPEYWGITNITQFLEEEKIYTEYSIIGVMAGNFLELIRVSIGEQDIIKSSTRYIVGHGNIDTAHTEAWVFWIFWVLCNLISAVVFLNFIVAEACESYTRVKETIDSVVQKGKASLVLESEEMVDKSKLNSTFYPKYLVVRTIEE